MTQKFFLLTNTPEERSLEYLFLMIDNLRLNKEDLISYEGKDYRVVAFKLVAEKGWDKTEIHYTIELI